MKSLHEPAISRLLLSIGALAIGTASVFAQNAAGSSTKALAVVNGKAITDADVRARAGEQFRALDLDYQKKVFELTQSTLDQVVEDRLIETEAATRRITKEGLLAQIRPAPVTDADIDAFYEQNKATIPRPKEQVAGQIRSYLEQQRQGSARQDFFNQLAAKYKVEKRLEPMRSEVAATGPSRGPTSAPVTIVLFTDFQSPYDSRLAPALQQVRVKYGDKVRVVVRQFPLPFHPNAQKAAEASLCAADQGKFWEMQDAMLADQQGLSIDQLKAKSARLGLSAAVFNPCLDSGKQARTIQTDMRDGAALGVNGTPALFVNGRFINGAVPLDQITAVIDDELRRKGVR